MIIREYDDDCIAALTLSIGVLGKLQSASKMKRLPPKSCFNALTSFITCSVVP